MKALFSATDSGNLPTPASNKPGDHAKRRVGSGAVKSMDRAFVTIEEENSRLHNQLASAERVVELNSAHVVPSFVADRLDLEGDPSFAPFVDSIRETGQRLPILVRPLPDRAGYYQAAFGHRRLKACQILRRPVKAIIREMSDEELIVSQGVENAERQNLSFIEQAMFAYALKERGYSRDTIANALGRDGKKGGAYISFLTNVAGTIPEDLIRQIGAAPGIGRPKWEKLGALFSGRQLSKSQAAVVQSLTSSTVWEHTGSDSRFAFVLEALQSRGQRPSSSTEEVREIDGVPFGLRVGASKTRISIPEQHLPGLGSWLVGKLPELVQQFRETRSEDDEMT